MTQHVKPVLQDRHALVTGATAGLGLAIAEKLAAAGANIVLNGLDDGTKAAADLASRFGVKATFMRADLSQETEIEAMMKEIADRFGQLDIVVNNAVVRSFAPIEHFASGDWNRALAVNLSAPFHIIRLALPGMKQRGFGRIINLSSIYATRATENRVDYVTTKTAILGLTRAVAIETIRSGITCNAICPATLPTPANRIAHRRSGCQRRTVVERGRKPLPLTTPAERTFHRARRGRRSRCLPVRPGRRGYIRRCSSDRRRMVGCLSRETAFRPLRSTWNRREIH
jgi:3-hydroxybutyrate dehydrogenase